MARGGRELDTFKTRLIAAREAAKTAAGELAEAEAVLARHAAENGLPNAPQGLEDALDKLADALPEARSRLQQRDRWTTTHAERQERHASSPSTPPPRRRPPPSAARPSSSRRSPSA